jgi:hypothetical protein
MRHRKLRIAWSVGWGALCVLLCLLVTLCGCDGHVHAFKPLPPPGKTAAEATAYKQKLSDAVTAVASQRGYTRWEPTPQSDDVLVFNKELERGRVQINLIADAKSGEYQVLIMDWPNTARSAESTAFEAAIREKLGVRYDEERSGSLIVVLIVTTLFAVVLGLIVYATRK